MGDIKELSRDELYTTAAQAYLSALKENKSALLIAPTWKEIEAVTEKVREGLMAQGHLAKEGHTFRVFDSLSWTDAQKRDARQYRVGQMLRFHQAKAGFARDELVEVANQGEQVTVCRQNGSMDLDPGLLALCFDVGEGLSTLKVGDKLLLQPTGATVH
jgi:hypothetical protein